MALKFYGGSPGSGKTYEVVENVILPALTQGRRVVTNIAGLDYEAICDFLVEAGHDRDNLGTIELIQLNDAIAGKFAVIVGDGEQAYLDEEKSIVRGGDIVVLDEVWRVWEDGTKLHPDDRRFLRMHRHLAHKETNVTCDIALISQAFTDVHRQVRSLIEERYEMQKLTKLGFRNRYLVSVFTKGTRKAHLVLRKKYRPEIHELYKSHSMGKEPGKEVEVDGRGNVLRGALFTIAIPLLILLGIGGLWFVLRFFNAETHGAKSAEKKPAANASAAAGNVTPGQTPDGKKTVDQDEQISGWRVTGYASDGNDAIIFLDVGGRSLMQRVADSKAVISGQYVEIELDGKKVGTFGGRDKKRDSGPVGSN